MEGGVLMGSHPSLLHARVEIFEELLGMVE